MHWRAIFFLFLIIGHCRASAQSPDSLSSLVRKITHAPLTGGVSRSYADSADQKIATYLQSSEPFLWDSIEGMNVHYDSIHDVRLLNWQVPHAYGSYSYYAYVQTPDSLYRLNDISEDMQISETMILRDGDWYGSYIYNWLDMSQGDTLIYLTLGYDGNDDVQRAKIIDFIIIYPEGTLETGYPGLIHEEGPYYRKIVKYNFPASIRVNYDSSLDYIVVDNLIPMADDLGRPGAVPDGSYQGYKRMPDGWHHVDRVWQDRDPLDNLRPSPVLDDRQDRMDRRDRPDRKE